MSIDLLQKPETKIHDVLDDFESTYWILYYGTIKRFLRPDTHQLMNIFEESVYDQKRGWIGGSKKLEWVLQSEGRVLECPWEPLKRLLSDLDAAWCVYHALNTNPEGRERELVDLRARYRTAEFWAEKFDVAIAQLHSKDTSPKERHTDGTRNKRRKTADEYSSESPRRSKRLKTRQDT